MNNNFEDSFKKNICRICLTSSDKDKIIYFDNKPRMPNVKIPKPKRIIDTPFEFDKSNDEKDLLDEKPKSISTVSLKINHCSQSNEINNDISLIEKVRHENLAVSKFEKVAKSKLEKKCKSKMCGSCKINSTKNKLITAQPQSLIKCKDTASFCTNQSNLIENVFNNNETENSSSTLKNGGNCLVCAEKEALGSELLLFFLNQMKNIVLTKELKLDSLKVISERLLQDKQNAELLMLMDLIIRFQVSKIKEIIFQDLLSKNIIPVNFTRVFLKQYEFLRSLSLAYSDILNDFESNFLFLHDLSFDLMNRAHFKIHFYDDCKEIQDLIDVGHFNIKEEMIFDIKSSDQEIERIRIIFSDMKSDFQVTDKWKMVQKKIDHVLNKSHEVGKSLLKYFHSYCCILSSRKSESKKDCFDICHSKAETYINSLKELARNNFDVMMKDASTTNPSSSHEIIIESLTNSYPLYQSNDLNFHSSILNQYYCIGNEEGGVEGDRDRGEGGGEGGGCNKGKKGRRRRKRRRQQRLRRVSDSTLGGREEVGLGEGMKDNCHKIYKSLASIKPPSLSQSSSSSANSNGYNSCASTSSFEGDCSDDDGVDRDSVKVLYSLRHDRRTCDSLSSNLHDNSLNEETKPPTPVSFTDDDECELRFEDGLLENHGRFIFKDKEHSWNTEDLNHDDVEKFNKLYEKYLAENEHLLLENTINLSPSSNFMSVPDCLQSLQSVETLHTLLNSIMEKCKKGLDIYDNHRPGQSKTPIPLESEISHPLAFSGHQIPGQLSSFSSVTSSSHLTKDQLCFDPNFIEIKEDDDNGDIDQDNENEIDDNEDDDFEMDFEELSRTLSPNSTIHENLREFEKYLARSLENCSSSEKSHPRLHALVKTCRIYCNKLYKRHSSKDDDILKESDSIDSLTDCYIEKNNKNSNMKKQTTIVIERMPSDDESCIVGGGIGCRRGSHGRGCSRINGTQDDCTSIINAHIDFGLENCVSIPGVNDSKKFNNNCSMNQNPNNSINYQPILSAESGSSPTTISNRNGIGVSGVGTGSSGNTVVGTDNATGNSKLCNCCKCEMFGEQTYFSHTRNVTNVVEKLRLKLQKRRQCQLISQSKKSIMKNSLNHTGTLEDVDTLVKFINGDCDSTETSGSQIIDLATPGAGTVNGGGTNTVPVPGGGGVVVGPGTSSGGNCVGIGSSLSSSKKTRSKINKCELSQLKSSSKPSPRAPSLVSVEYNNKSIPVSNVKSSKKSKAPEFCVATVSNTSSDKINNNSKVNNNNNNDELKTNWKSITPVLKPKGANERNCLTSNLENRISESCDDINNDDDKEFYDPVVEDFKTFCEKILVVPKRRKKLPIDPILLISELEKWQQEKSQSHVLN